MVDSRAAWGQLHQIALVGTFVPRRCGIGTFTYDLLTALQTLVPEAECGAVAINDRLEGYAYSPHVKFEVLQQRRPDYALAADYINMGRADVVSLQHEYGIYGGHDGRMIVDMLRRIRVPVISTLHTILKDPSDGQRRRLREIAELSDRIVALSEMGVQFLREIYDLPAEKVVMIPHGIHDVPFIDPNYYKDKYGVEGRKVMLTFGLLSPNKGIETMIEALPGIVSDYPDVIYMVLGATHPGVMASHGEEYRASLIERAEQLGVRDHVKFINRFVDTAELMEYLGCADMYITPYLNEAQIVSGTLAYAMGAGKATISTPYWYAQEMLTDGRGVLVPFADPRAMAEAINHLFGADIERHAMRKRAYEFTRQMRWSEVAAQYMDLFAAVQQERSTHPKSAAFRHAGAPLSWTDLKGVNLHHLLTMTDDTGLLQHARFDVPRRCDGYCTDDNARALVAVVKAADHVELPGGDLTGLASRYLSFLEHAFNDESGRFRNFMSYDRRWLEEDGGSEDSHGRALWALGAVVSRSHHLGHARLAGDLFQHALPATLNFQYPMAWSYSLIGVHDYLRRFSGDSGAKRVRDELATRLYERWRQNAAEDWPWPLDQVTYGSGRMVQALLLSGRWTFTQGMVDLALRALQWLIDKQTSPDGHYAPVGCDGWYQRGGSRARFDQQPIEASCLIAACVEAHHITRDDTWIHKAHWCFRWFLGENDLRLPLCDPHNGGCYDGLTPEGVNQNQGAESTLAWLHSLLDLGDYAADPEMKMQANAESSREADAARPGVAS